MAAQHLEQSPLARGPALSPPVAPPAGLIALTEFLLADQQYFQCEVRVGKQAGEANQLRENILDRAPPRRPAPPNGLAILAHPQDPLLRRDGIDEAQGVIV